MATTPSKFEVRALAHGELVPALAESSDRVHSDLAALSEFFRIRLSPTCRRHDGAPLVEDRDGLLRRQILLGESLSRADSRIHRQLP